MNNRYIKIEGSANMVKDRNTGAVINTSRADIERARAAKRKRLEEEQEINNLKDDVSHMKKDMADIKTLLKQLVDK
jgi:hypothetical protein|tara:strand:- start:24886 stop:25113 length:228 start_codon:yes stop_codon:yes gene_type:complete